MTSNILHAVLLVFDKSTLHNVLGEIVHDVFIIFTGIAVNVAINSTIEIEDVDVPLITTFNLLALVIELVIIKRG